MPDLNAAESSAPAAPFDTPQVKDPATILEDAADLLLIHGRCRGVGIDEEGRLCVRGALAVARGDDPRANTAVCDQHSPGTPELERHLAQHMFSAMPRTVRHAWSGYVDRYGAFPAFAWNDSLRTEDDDFEVIDTLRHVAKDLRNAAVA